METNNLIAELYAIVQDPNLQPDLEYFKKYNLTDDNLIKIKAINDNIAQNAYRNNEIQMRQQQKLLESGDQTFELIKNMKLGLNDTLESNRRAQSISTWMYIFSFCLGLGLIITSVVFAVMDRPILAIAFEIFGMVDIVAHFIADPPARLQESRSNYVQLTGLTLAWFKETLSNDAYMATSLLGSKEMLDNYNSLSENYVTNTGKFFQMMDDLAEPQIKKNKKKKKKAEVAQEAS
ncbi:hypothetical protein [Gelidibacter mesophilus]|uniref:hypothetical protein n=1 Tax=Gelidibacter mesophilus TaxID=169050 RepID=UPI0004062122|nr:hypothetical protein [Gelidibacter mesophilus]